MDIQSLILEHYRFLLLAAGALLLFLGVMPIVSRDYYLRHVKKKGHFQSRTHSEEDAYIDDRYLNQIYPLFFGSSLVIGALYKFVFPTGSEYPEKAIYFVKSLTTTHKLVLLGVLMLCVYYFWHLVTKKEILIKKATEAKAAVDIDNPEYGRLALSAVILVITIYVSAFIAHSLFK